MPTLSAAFELSPSAGFLEATRINQPRCARSTCVGWASFLLVDAAIAPIFRYFDILAFESTHQAFDGLERVANWRHALAQRPSIKAAVAEDYATRLRQHLQD